jgi:hypothetical protein
MRITRMMRKTRIMRMMRMTRMTDYFLSDSNNQSWFK